MFNRLRLKITVGTAFILGLFLLLLGMYIISSQRLQLVHNLQDHGNRIASLAARSSAEYIQRFSFFLMEDQAMSIEQSPNIAFCEIYDTEGVSLLQSGNIISKDHTGKHKAKYDENTLIVTQQIVAGETTLGMVEIGLRLDSVEEAIREKTTHLTILFSGFTLCVVLVLNLFFHKLFIKPVLTLADGTQKVAARDFVTIDVGNRNDEIGLLSRNFNVMSKNLQELYRNLESKVEERTQALKQANTDLLIAIDQAKDMAKKAEEGTLAKSQFLATMSHEIRTPMNAVLGMGEVLNGSDLDDEQRRYVRILLESGNALLSLIDDILDLSKIEAGEMVFENMPFTLEEVIDKAFKVTSYAGHKKGLDLDYVISPDVPAEFHGDPLRLQQILINLLGNGVKFTDSGAVLLEVSIDPDSRRGETNEKLMVNFCVRDNGVGIEPGKVKTLFEKFTQADASTTRRHGGTGLGLSICQLLCENMGGCIWIESELGHGCSVFFSLPYQEHHTSQRPPSVLDGKHILLVDDREYAPAALASRMERAGARVDTRAGLDEAKVALQSERDQAPLYDVVIVNTPVDGERWRSVTASLIEYGIAPKKIIVLLTNDTGHTNSMRSFCATLAKPAAVSEIEAAVARMVTPELLPQHSPSGPARPARALDILLLEDSEANRMLVELYLKDTPHRLVVATNGGDGLDLFKENSIDLVFMDIEMPVMDGFECTRRLREWESENGRHPVQIIALTAHALNEIKERILSAGCNTFLTKPISRKDFLHAVRMADELQLHGEKLRGHRTL